MSVTCFRVVGVCKYRVSIRGTGSTQNEQQHGRPDLSTIARAGMLRECLGQVRYVAAADRKKAIVGKSRVEPNRLQSPAFVFLILAITGFMFSELHGKESLPKMNGKLGSCQLPGNRGIFPLFGDVAQGQINEFSGCLITGKVSSVFEHFA